MAEDVSINRLLIFLFYGVLRVDCRNRASLSICGNAPVTWGCGIISFVMVRAPSMYCKAFCSRNPVVIHAGRPIINAAYTVLIRSSGDRLNQSGHTINVSPVLMRLKVTVEAETVPPFEYTGVVQFLSLVVPQDKPQS